MLSQRWPFLDVRQTHSSCLWVVSNRVVLHLDLVALPYDALVQTIAQLSAAHQQPYQMIKCLKWGECSCSLKLFYSSMEHQHHSPALNHTHDMIPSFCASYIALNSAFWINWKYLIIFSIHRREICISTSTSFITMSTYMVLNNNILIFWRIRDRLLSWIIISWRTRSGPGRNTHQYGSVSE